MQTVFAQFTIAALKLLYKSYWLCDEENRGWTLMDADNSTKDNEMDLRLFLVSQGKEIVVANLATGKILRYQMPKP